jgi:plastocyanin
MRLITVATIAALASSRVPAALPAAGAVTADTTVAIRTFHFRPDVLVIPQGTRVTWTNADEIEHTITAGIPDSPTGDYSGVVSTQGSTFSHTFDRAGTFTYFCDRHHFMRGQVRVVPLTHGES